MQLKCMPLKEVDTPKEAGFLQDALLKNRKVGCWLISRRILKRDDAWRKKIYDTSITKSKKKKMVFEQVGKTSTN
jgi:hypothetical protein